ncbi:MAG: response regulator transcription factor [Clostridia bacterium]|nr:response regulator transcription factor [Clostridia bacterium]
MEKIKLLLIDDDSTWLKGIAFFLNKEEDFIVVGAVTTKEDALKFIANFDIDVILTDLFLVNDKHDGISLTLEIQNIKKVKTIMLTSFREKEIIADSFAAGAVNYFCKDNYEALPNAIRSTFRNCSPIEIIGQEYTRLREENKLSVLTEAEREVYEMKKLGYTLTQIGESLHKSTSTLKKQMNHILKKLGITRFEEIKRSIL